MALNASTLTNHGRPFLLDVNNDLNGGIVMYAKSSVMVNASMVSIIMHKTPHVVLITLAYGDSQSAALATSALASDDNHLIACETPVSWSQTKL